MSRNGDRSETPRGRAERICAAVGELYRRSLGHLPRRVECRLVDQVLAIQVHGSETVFERTLVGAGQGPLVDREREVIRELRSDGVRAAVESELGKRVLSQHGSMDPADDVEVLMLNLGESDEGNGGPDEAVAGGVQWTDAAAGTEAGGGARPR